MAQLMSGCRMQVPHQARIYGRQGRIVVDDFFHPHGFTIEVHDQEPEVVHMPFESTAYQYEAREVQDCLAAGKLTSDLCPVSETRAILQTMDTLRQQWGLRYPSES